MKVSMTPETTIPDSPLERDNTEIKPSSEAEPIDNLADNHAGSRDGSSEKSSAVSAAAVRAAKLHGVFEGFDELEVIGWVADRLAPSSALAVEVLADGKLIARQPANKFRGDLAAAGIGQGYHGFTIGLPAMLCDGAEHTIVVREMLSSRQLEGSPRLFKTPHGTIGKAALESSAISGWVRFPEPIQTPITIHAYENDEPIAVTHIGPDPADQHLARFIMALPASVLDGRPHAFSVRVREPAVLISQVAAITPYFLTPESALQKYARECVKSSLMIQARLRYESLIGRMQQLAAKARPSSVGAFQHGREENLDIAAEIRQVMQAHAQLVKGFSDTDKRFAPIIFPSVEAPKVSVVIPVHNKFPVTYNCLASLLLAPNNASFEVILVDDGSTDTSTEIPQLISGVQYVRNETALGFIRACNRGASVARGEYVVMLNNDTEVTAYWLDELLWGFERFDGVGMTGAKLLYPDGKLQEAGGIVWNTGDPWNYGRSDNAYDPRYNYTRQADYLSGACLMLPKKLWDLLGGFDEALIPAYFEDTDLAFRVREKGFKVVYTPFSQVIHFEGISNGTDTKSSGTKRYQEINRPKFRRRWARVCRHNGNVGEDVDLNKDRNIDFRCLVLDATAPQPDKDAGGYAAIQEMRILQSLGFKCTFVPQNVAWMAGYTETLQRMGVECLFAPFVLSVNEVFEKRGNEFDVIYITRYYIAEQYIDMIRYYAPNAKVVLNNADLHFLRELRSAIASGSRDVLAKSIATRDAELATMRKVDLVLSYSDVEQAVILSHNLDSTVVAQCPWVIEVPEKARSLQGRKDIAFLGGFNHHPNVEAVEWFVPKVMPLLRKALPGVSFRIYGSHPPDSFAALADDDVVIEGWVADVAEVYDSCRVFIAPLQTGAGLKGKVVGALAHGVPCVLSPVAAEGIPLGDGVDACIARKPEEWVSAIVHLYQDPQAWADMSRQALVFARNQYGFAKGVAKMQEALQQAEIFPTTKNNALALR
jgi:GT2 family glycosyltransferase